MVTEDPFLIISGQGTIVTSGFTRYQREIIMRIHAPGYRHERNQFPKRAEKPINNQGGQSARSLPLTHLRSPVRGFPGCSRDAPSEDYRALGRRSGGDAPMAGPKERMDEQVIQ